MSSFSNQNESAGNSNADPHKHRLDYQPVVVDECLEEATRRLIRLAIQEDLSNSLDWTTVCLIDQHQIGACNVVAREEGVACGMALAKWIIDEMDADLTESCLLEDGARFQSGQTLIELQGNVRDLLTAERTILNLLSRLCGVATLTARYVKAMSSETTRLYDTRKTTPGWRLLEKYAVLCGGAHNHRIGLHDGFLIKDNHLALAGTAAKPLSVAEATARAIRWRGNSVKSMQAPSIVEVEVDSDTSWRPVNNPTCSGSCWTIGPCGPCQYLFLLRIRLKARCRGELSPRTPRQCLACGCVASELVCIARGWG